MAGSMKRYPSPSSLAWLPPIDRVFPHVDVHGGDEEDRRLGGHQGGGEKVVGDAAGHLADDVGGGRGHDEEIGPVGQGDVADLALLVEVEELGVHRVPGEGLEGQRA